MAKNRIPHSQTVSGQIRKFLKNTDDLVFILFGLGILIVTVISLGLVP